MDPLIALAIKLPPRGSRARRTALYQQLRAAILDGRLKPGLRLPSTRGLAATYAVSRNTAVAAYDLLLSEGYLSARRGSGTSIADSLPQAMHAGADLSVARPRQLNAHWHRGRGKSSPDAHAAPRIVFRVGMPDHKAFPYITWHRLSGHVMRRFHAGFRPDREPQGLPALREAIARHVSFARAVACGPDDILVTAGAQQAFDLLARVLSSRQRTTVALENPGYPPLRAAFAAHGARIVPVPIDDEGLVVERLPQKATSSALPRRTNFPWAPS
jgi:GntR family transcriptional regulator / MocR family aminotransferase